MMASADAELGAGPRAADKGSPRRTQGSPRWTQGSPSEDNAVSLSKIDKCSAKEDSAGTPQPAQAPHPPRCFGVPLKYVSLVSLTLQTSGQVFVIKWARATSTVPGSGGEVAYLASSVVLFTEVLKTAVSCFLVMQDSGGISNGIGTLRTHFTRSYVETLKVSVPALLYTVQNNMMFFSLSKLTMGVQQVTYQLKILTTAVLSVVILGKVLDATKWIALLLLLGGVTLVQWPRSFEKKDAVEQWLDSDSMLGLAAVLAAAFTSGLASVYLEKLLKQTNASIWVRNVQLGVFGIFMAMLVAYSTDGERIARGGFMQGFTIRVLCVISNNAFGGLLCAAVLKYADNLLRCFSTALSIILTCFLSYAVLEEFVPDELFAAGTLLAICATFLYSLGLPGSPRSWAHGLAKAILVPTSLASKKLSGAE